MFTRVQYYVLELKFTSGLVLPWTLIFISLTDSSPVFEVVICVTVCYSYMFSIKSQWYCCFRMNTSAGAARPNPQGSFHFGSINITQTFVLKNEQPLSINGKRRRTINRVSYSPPETPLRLADLHNLTGVYTTDFPAMPSNAPARIASSALNASYKGFLEIVFQNNDTDVQTYHLDGYSFFVVGYVLNHHNLQF